MPIETSRAPHFVFSRAADSCAAQRSTAFGSLAAALRAGALATLVLCVGCGSDAECVIDSDCASLAQRCEANACVPLSAPQVDLGRADMGSEGGVRDGSTDGAVDGATIDAGPTATRNGFFYAESSPSFGFASAAFSETPPTPPGPCTTRTDGPCSVTVCAPGVSTAEARSAGTLTVSGGTAELTLAPNADDTYTAASVPMELFASGAMLSFSATGNADGGVPAFTGMVTAPSGATLTAPALTDGVPLAIAAGSDLPLAWTAAGATGSVDVRFGAATSDGGTVGARCRFPITNFMGTIPAAAFSDFPAGSTGTYSFYLEAEAGVTSGDWNVALGARNPMSTSTGAASTGSATF